MRVAIDLTALMPQQTGVDVLLRELFLHITQIPSEFEYTFLVNREDCEQFRDCGATVEPVASRGRATRWIFQQVNLPSRLAAGGFDVLHSPSFLMPLRLGRARHLLSVHDATFFTMPEVHSRLRRSLPFRSLVAASIRKAHLISVPSAAVKADLDRLFPTTRSRVRVTPYGVGAQFSPASAADTETNIDRLRLPKPYVLYVGTIEPRKNLPAIIEGFRSLIRRGNKSHTLVLTGGKGWDVEHVYRMAAAEDLRGRIHLTGYVSSEDLPWVFRGASAFVYPSLAEGFGFPPLEAMACGVPVISSRVSPLLENLGGAAELVPASDHEALAAALERVLTDPALRARMVAAGLERAASFRWQRTASQVIDCYRELVRTR